MFTTQVELVRDNARQVTWVKTKSIPRVGQAVSMPDTGMWTISAVYCSTEDHRVHESRSSKKTFGSIDCF